MAAIKRRGKQNKGNPLENFTSQEKKNMRHIVMVCICHR